MGERCICYDYAMKFCGNGGDTYEMIFELWINGPNNWWLTFGGVPQEEDQFTPQQIQAILDYIYDWYAK